MKMIRQTLKTFISDLREIRADKSVACLLGDGCTIAVEGEISAIHKGENGYNFSASWNRGAMYWPRKIAEQIVSQLKTNINLEVIHQNDLRDRHEARAKHFVSVFFAHRNS